MGSALLRLVVPVVGGIIGGLAGPSCTTPPDGGVAGVVGTVVCVSTVGARILIGLGIGALVAAAIDDGALGWDRGPADRSALAVPRIAPFAVIATDRDHGSVRVVGVAGTF